MSILPSLPRRGVARSLALLTLPFALGLVAPLSGTAGSFQSARAEAPPSAAPERLAGPPSTSPSGGPQELQASAQAPGESAAVALPRDTTVLHLGDSFAGALGAPLQELLGKAGIRSVLHYKDASYIPEWASPKMGVNRLVTKTNPDLVLITLGGNELDILEPGVRAEPIRRLVAQLGGRPCVWVAPSIPAHNALPEVIRNNLAPCRFFDTRARVPELPRLPDRVHPTLQGRRQWAELLLRWLQAEREPRPEVPWALRPEAPPADTPRGACEVGSLNAPAEPTSKRP